MKRLLYVIGEPAVGKTTFAKNLILRLASDPETIFLDCSPIHPLIKGHRFLSDFFEERTVIGNYDRERGLFAGTDALSMACMPKAIEMLQERPSIYFGEGDRLGSLKFFEAAKEIGYDVRVIKISASEETLAERQKERGNKQSAAFLKGRRTKVERISKAMDVWLEVSAEDSESRETAARKAVEFLSVVRD